MQNPTSYKPAWLLLWLLLVTGVFYIFNNARGVPNTEKTHDTPTPQTSSVWKPQDRRYQKPSTAQFLKEEERHYQSLIAARQKRLAGVTMSKLDIWDTDREMYLWDYFVPDFNCPHDVRRVGALGDGGKFVCGYGLLKQGLAPQCVVYSFGVRAESSFESAIVRDTPCNVWAYDYTVNKMGNEAAGAGKRIHFQKLGLGSEARSKRASGSPMRTLRELMDVNGHRWIDILKVDIEGGEYDVLEQIVQEFQTKCVLSSCS